MLLKVQISKPFPARLVASDRKHRRGAVDSDSFDAAAREFACQDPAAASDVVSKPNTARVAVEKVLPNTPPLQAVRVRPITLMKNLSRIRVVGNRISRR
jgi:hypothetical protein